MPKPHFLERKKQCHLVKLSASTSLSLTASYIKIHICKANERIRRIQIFIAKKTGIIYSTSTRSHNIANDKCYKYSIPTGLLNEDKNESVEFKYLKYPIFIEVKLLCNRSINS